MNGRRGIFRGLSVLLLTLVVAAPHAVAQDVLALVPEDAWGFVVVKNLRATNAKIEQLGKRVGRPVPSPLLDLKARVGVQQGLDEEGDALLVVLPPTGASALPTLIVAAPVADYDAFVGQFTEDAGDSITALEIQGREMLVAEKGGHALITGAESRAALEALLKREPKLTAEVAPLSEWLATNQFAAMALPAGIKAGMDKVLEALETGRTTFRQMAENMPEEQARQIRRTAKMMDSLDGFCSGIKDEVSTFSLGLRIDADDNVFFASRTRAVEGGEFAAWTELDQKQEINLLAGLPAGPYVFAGGTAVSEEMYTALIRMSTNMMKANPEMYGGGMSEEDIEKITEASIASVQGLSAMSMSMAPGEGNDSVYDTMSAVLTVDDPATYLANYKKSIQATSGLMKGPNGEPLMEVEAADVEIAGVTAVKMTMDMSGMRALQSQNVEQMKGFFEMMMGEGGKINVYVAAVGEHTVLMKYGSEEDVTAAVKAIQDGEDDLSDDAQLARTAALLPKGGQAVVYISPSGAVAAASRIMGMVATAMGQAAPPVVIPPFPESPPVGGTIHVVPGGLETEEVIPGEVLEVIGNYVRQLR